MDFVHCEQDPKPPKWVFMFFFKELAQLIEKASNRPECTRFKRELKNSLNWVYFKAMLKDDIKDTSALLSDPKVYKWRRMVSSCVVGGPEEPDDPRSDKKYRKVLVGRVSIPNEENHIKEEITRVNRENLGTVTRVMTRDSIPDHKMNNIKIQGDTKSMRESAHKAARLLSPIDHSELKALKPDIFSGSDKTIGTSNKRIRQNEMGHISTPTLKRSPFGGSKTKQPPIANSGPKLLMANKNYATAAKGGGWGSTESHKDGMDPSVRFLPQQSTVDSTSSTDKVKTSSVRPKPRGGKI
jgi:hypothetical protein